MGKDRLVRDASAGLGILTKDIGRLEHAVYCVSAGATLGNQGGGEQVKWLRTAVLRTASLF